jgi:hypothetical protein
MADTANPVSRQPPPPARPLAASTGGETRRDNETLPLDSSASPILLLCSCSRTPTSHRITTAPRLRLPNTLAVALIRG